MRAKARKPYPIPLSEEQRERLNRMWMIYGNMGLRHTHANHSFLRSLLERGEYDSVMSLFERARPDSDLVESVDRVLGIQSVHPSIDRLPAYLRVGVESVSDERPLDGFWIYTKKGFRNSEAGTHAFHEKDPKTTVARLRWELEPCECDQCKAT